MSKKSYTLILISASLAMLMVKLDAYIVNISLPTIAQNFGTSRDIVSLVLLSYLVASTATLLLFGMLGDRLGLKKIFILGFVLFTLGSLLCGLSPCITILIISRFIQGLGGSMLVANCLAIVGRFMPHDKVGSSYGILTTIAAIGVSLGAPLGGIITFYASWHWIFLINIPFGAVAIWMANKYIPGEQKEKFSFKEFDFTGAILVLLAFTFLILAFNSFDNRGLDAIMPYAALVLSAIFFGLFILREKKAANPILDLSLFRMRPLTLALIASLLASSTSFGNSYMMPFYLEKDVGLTANWVGMLILISSLVIMVLAPLSGKMSDKIHPVKICSIAFIIGIINFTFFSATLGMLSLWIAVVFLFFAGIFTGLFISPNNKMIMDMAVEGKHGIVSATANTFSSMAAVFGVSVFQMIYSITTGGDYAKPSMALNINGFRNAYICGIILLVFALIVTWFSRSSGSKDPESHHNERLKLHIWKLH
ncbi:MAG: MFS transporter [Bacteroidetes bacterium]|nr:MFS transporter [Bacteroidota bacterium]